ncbi:hypothetical protein F5883DRAFT_255110 [Diaporthe sp. PMI_573]|nr:hypothetical protein F5883DRAFT_255110 [Diaporthaceae sp. PMI_573]
MWLLHAAGQVVGHRCSPAHIITPPMMTHRTRDNGRPTTSDRVLCHSTNSRSRTPWWATAHLYSYSVHTNKLFFFQPPSCPPPTPIISSLDGWLRSILSLDLLFSAPATNHRHPTEKFPRAAAGPDPLSSSHVRTLPDVALRWGLASAVARLASSRLHSSEFSCCASPASVHVPPGTSLRAAVATLEIQGLFWVSAEIRLMREQKPVSQPIGIVLEQQLLSASGGSARRRTAQCGVQEPSRRCPPSKTPTRTIDQGTHSCLPGRQVASDP